MLSLKNFIEFFDSMNNTYSFQIIQKIEYRYRERNKYSYVPMK